MTESQRAETTYRERKKAGKQRVQSDLHGILVIDKPGQGDLLPDSVQDNLQAHGERLPTSHDIVQRVRRRSGQRRIGHTGTLDPMASGVLVLCLGLATRLVEYYQGHDKRYYAEIELGTATDTYDALGTVTARGDVPPFSHAQIEAALDRFRGTIQQQPPVYSALKQGGESAHRRARRGEEVDLPARTVTFHDLDLVESPTPQHEPQRIILRAHCSAGTYMRSLAHDLGAALGVPAHLAALRREAAGAFTLEDAHTLAAVEAAAQENRLASLLLAPGTRLDLPAYTVDAEQIRLLGFGQKVELAGAPAHSADKPKDASLAQAYDGEGRFLGIIRCLSGDPQTHNAAGEHAQAISIWKAEKWLAIDGNQAGATSGQQQANGEIADSTLVEGKTV